MPFTLATPIAEALAQLPNEPSTLPGAEKSLLITPPNDSASYVVLPGALAQMATMGLTALPLGAVALPQQLAKLPCRISAEPDVLDLSNTLTTYFSSYLTAALYELQSLCKKSDLQAYIIGGQVRDMLLQTDNRFEFVDVDITVEANAIEAAQRIVAHSRNFTVAECFPEFGTATLLYKNDIRFDMASTRGEHYTACGALPTVDERGVPLADDIGRRDFTVNTLAMSIHNLGQVQDYASGQADITARTLRILHPLSFYEDPSRILRALKFLIRLDLEIDPLTEYALLQFLRFGNAVYAGGGDRIRTEMAELFSRPESPVKRRWMAYFYHHQVFQLASMAEWPTVGNTQMSPTTEAPLVNDVDVLPFDVAPIEDQLLALEANAPAIQDILLSAHPAPPKTDDDTDDSNGALLPYDHAKYLRKRFLWLFHLWRNLLHSLPDEPALTAKDGRFRRICKRLEITKQERELLTKAWRLLANGELANIQSTLSPIRLYQLCQHHAAESLLMAAITAYADKPERLTLVLNAIHRLEAKLRPVKPLLKGDDLMALGIPAGEQLGNTLEAILFQKLLGRLRTKEDELTYVKQQCLTGACKVDDGQ